MSKSTCFLKKDAYNKNYKRREEAHRMMQNEKFTEFDLDDLIYGTATLVPSER